MREPFSSDWEAQSQNDWNRLQSQEKTTQPVQYQQPMHQPKGHDPHREKMLNHMLERYEDEYHLQRLEKKGIAIRVNGQLHRVGIKEPTEEKEASEMTIGLTVIGVLVIGFRLIIWFAGG